MSLPNGLTRTAVYTGDQGCVALPKGAKSLNFTPVGVKPNLPDAAKTAWPMGNQLPSEPPAGLDLAKIHQAIDAALTPVSGLTAALVVTWKGRLIGERYGTGIDYRTPLESWSMGKSLSATIMEILIRQGVYDLWQPAPIPEWQAAGDPHGKIRIADIRHMSTTCRAVSASVPHRTRTMTQVQAIPTTSTSTLAQSIHSSTPRPGRSSGRQTPLAATGTPIRC